MRHSAAVDCHRQAASFTRGLTFPAIVWAGANGELVEPEAEHKFSAECIINNLKSKKGRMGQSGQVAKGIRGARFVFLLLRDRWSDLLAAG